MTQIEKIRAVLDSGMSETQKIEVIRDVVKASADTSMLDYLRQFAAEQAKQPKQVAPFYVPYPVYPTLPPYYPRPWAVPMEVTCGPSNAAGAWDTGNYSRSHEVTGAHLRITSGGQS